ncbi:MAG: alpha/beta hydrolase [Alphaproteobacteria bacterium]|nr:alpha/beta hydrolase [Alphaproteobacteria bacterium]
MSAPAGTPSSYETNSTNLKNLPRPDGATIAYHRRAGGSPGVIFCGGFRSAMTGTKALFLDDFCQRRSRAFVRFDYFGHGASFGDFADGTIGRWVDDAISVIDSLTEGPQVLVGSSMGGWIMLLAALARPERIAGLLGVAAAPDFTRELLWGRLDEAQQRELTERGQVLLPSEYDPAGYLYTRRLIDDGARHCLLHAPIAIDVPVRLLHGTADVSVPWQLSQRLAERLTSTDVTLTLVKDGDHRLSSDTALDLLARTLDGLCGSAA